MAFYGPVHVTGLISDDSCNRLSPERRFPHNDDFLRFPTVAFVDLSVKFTFFAFDVL